MDIKRKLRELEPSVAAEGALKEIDNLMGDSSNIQKKSLTLELISEFVFFEKSGQPMSRFDELRILQTLCTHFGSESSAGRHDLFAIMFNKDTLKNQKSFFHKLILMSVLLQVKNVLAATGVFMNQLGNLSPESIGICEMLVQELFVNYPACHEYLAPIGRLSPLFASNFITGICSVYFNRRSANELKLPSEKLLEIVADWLTADTSVLVANSDRLHNSKSGKNELALIGLMRWSVLAPLYQPHAGNDEAGPIPEPDSGVHKHQLQIHLQLLLGIQAIPVQLHEPIQAPVRVPVAVFVPLLHEIRFAVEAKKLSASEFSLMTAYIRLTQLLVNLKGKKILEGDTGSLAVPLKRLPENVYLTALLELL